MPGETKEVPSAGTDTLTPIKTKHQTTSSKAALARVNLLDGSILDVTIDRKAKGRDLINSICAGLNIQEKEYFGLIYATPVDPRVWLDLEKPVSKFFKTDPWVLQFAVKFYPPEPAQLKEDITRYQLCLQVRNDILEGRLPCSFVTHALLGSYLVQSEMGDYDPKEMPDRSYLKDFKIAPNQSPDLEDKVMDLHKSHRGQSPAEAELHYLENAKKLALYGVDLHPVKDSEGVDIMLGVCSAGIFVHRDKLRINRFAWPKILKISYKRHHFYVKIRPGEFEHYESTIGFKLANHRAAKKLWKSCVEHHTFFRLMTPEQPNKAGLFPRFGSKYRYTGPTMAESRNNTLTRDQPRFDRTLSGRGLPSKSMDGIVQAEKKKNDPKRQSLPPDSIEDPIRSRSPLKNDKKEKESPEKDKKKQINGTEENGDKTPSRGRTGIFGSGRKSPRKDKGKEKLPVAVAVSEGSPSPDKSKSHTRPYEYSESDLDVSPTRRSYNVGGFSYDQPNDGNRSSVTNGNDGQLSPGSKYKKTALAFNYAPEDEKLREHADKILYGQLSPKTKDKLAKGQLSPKSREKLLKDVNLSPKTRRLLSGDGLPPKDGRSYSPSSPAAEYASGASGKYTPIDGATKVIPGVALGGGKPKKKQVKIMLIISKFDPKTKAIDTENGHVEHLTGLMDTETGIIDTRYGQVNPKKATLESYNPQTNKVELFHGDIDGKTGNLHFTTGGVVDPRTGKVDNSLGEIVSIVSEENPVVELTCITSRIDPKTQKVDIVNGDLEYSPAVLDIENQVLHTKYGQIHLRTRELKIVDPKTGKVISSNKNISLDKQTQQITINGIVDPKTGKIDPNQGRLIEVGQQIDPLVEVTTISGKLDSKKNTIDPKSAGFEKSTGQYNPKTGKVNTKYGQLDLVNKTLTSIDPKTGKSVVKDVKVDPVSGQVVVKNQINPKTGKHDKDFARIMSLKIITTRLDPVTKQPILSQEDAIVDPVTNQIWAPTGAVDPITKEKQYVSSTVDPRTGTIITIYGYLNKANEIRKQTKIDGNMVKVDPDTSRVFTATGETDKIGAPLYATTEFDPTTGEIYTKVGKVDPKTKKIILVKILLLSKPDPTTGQPQEVDPDTCDIDPVTGRVTKFFNKTVYVYNMVDPLTGDIIQVDANDPRIVGAGAKTTVTQTMTLSGEIDPITGRIKTEWGHIDPKTGDIDPKTAVKDPVTGKLILNYALIDPNHFGKDKIRRSSVASSDNDEMAEYTLDQTPKKPITPTVVQTTTKQVITKNDDGVVHNVQEEIRNLGTGEVTISTQEHKVSPTKEQTPKRLTEPVVTAAVPKPSKQTHDLYSAFLEGERYNKEPTYTSPEKKITTTEALIKASPPTTPTKSVESTKTTGTPTVPEFATASTAFVPEPLANIVKDKPVKVLSITSGIDPKTKRIDIENGKIEQTEAKINPTTGLIKTKYGILNPEKGTLEDIKSKEVVQGTIDSKTGRIHFTNDPSQGQILSVVPNDKIFVELTIISSKFEPNSTRINPLGENCQLEKCVGVLDLENGTLDTKYGQLCTKTGEIKSIDPKNGKVQITKNAIVTDPNTGQLLKVNGLPDPKTGKIDNSLGCLIEIGQQIDPVVEIISVAGKMDKRGLIDPKTTTVETTLGQYNPETGKIDTKYGQLDLIKHTIMSSDPKNNKTIAKDIKIDPISGQITLKNMLNPKSNKVEKDFGRILNVKIVSKDESHKTGAIVLDSKTNQLWKPTGIVDKQYVTSKVDPKTGQITLVYGYLDPKTNEVQPNPKLDENIVKVDSKTGKLYTIIEESDKSGEPLYATTYVDQESGEVYTKVGKYDPATKTIVLVKIYLISKVDPATGKPQLVDPTTCTVDPETGRVTKFFNKTVYVYNMVDPITGEIIQVDPNDPRVAGAKTTVIQTLTLTGEIDPVTGRIKTEYGHIDPNTGDIEPSTAVKDPVTGKLILNYADIDPTHFGKQVTVTKETVPISRDEFFEGIKKIEKSTSGTAAPTVVKTTTKQVITKTDDGVTHNLEEEVRNLGTGEITYSTQEHKADASGNDSSGAYLQATAVTTRTATTHEDLGKKARTEQLEEKTVGTTRTYDPTKQEQRVVTQEVKTTVTATSGDQYTRRESISSTSSGDSGTPIDGLDEYTGSSSPYKPSEHHVTSDEPSRVVLGQTSTGIAEGEIVSSQTVSSKTRTVETITYKTERDGIVETRVEQKITIQSDGDPIDHDKALAEAIQEATAMNPDMTVEKIEIQQQTQ